MSAALAALDYDQAVAALQSRGRYGVNLGLERIQRLLDELDHPEDRLHGALVGGTNGKGSVVALVRSVLQAAGRRVGTMPKPHLVSYRERIAIDGEPVSEERFAAAVSEVLAVVDRVAPVAGDPTEFETLTAAAVLELSRSGIDEAIVEVGLGGRLDATNALDLGVAAISNVQLDHEQQLGGTLRLIGAEKAAIIKPGDAAVTGASGHGLAPIVARCQQLGVALRRAGPRQAYRATLVESDWDGIVIDLHTPVAHYPALRVGLLGAHQAMNAAVAAAMLDALTERAERRGEAMAISEAALRRGMADARWPGRMELIRNGPPEVGPVLLDGAHNPAGARALARALRDLGQRGMPLVFGAMRSKRVTGILRALVPLRPQPVFTAVDEPGVWQPDELLTAWRRVGGEDGERSAEPMEALRMAARLRDGDEPIVVAGSLYLVGAVRGALQGDHG
jgi:dihydrofolate synthase/folylpolyglutamate synthase